MKFIVTGGLGFIGSHLTEFLVSQGHDVIVIDNLHGGKLENLCPSSKVEFIKLDIREYEKLKILSKNTDGIFHEAGLTSVPESFIKQDEYYDVNVIGTENVFKIAQEVGIKVVFASSAAIYGNVSKPIAEDFERKPENPYGETKLKAELLSEKYSKLGTRIIGLRYFNVYGLRQNPSYAGVITKFLTNLKNKNPLVIHGDGLQVRDFVYVSDVVTANFLAMKSKVDHDLVNIGSGVPVSINELANLIIELSDSKVKLLYDDAQMGDIRFSQADINLAKKLFEWEPKMNLKGWLKSIVKDNL